VKCTPPTLVNGDRYRVALVDSNRTVIFDETRAVAFAHLDDCGDGCTEGSADFTPTP
jgi:hypothetical protein